MADVRGLMADPQFQSLDSASQRAVLGRVDPAFSNLSDDELTQFKTRMGGAPSAATTAPSQPGFFGELWNVNAAPLIHLFHAVTSNPLAATGEVARGMWDSQADQGRQAWAALTGNNGYTPLQRASETFGHGLAAITPVVGPMAAHAGENFSGSQPTFDKFGNVTTPGQSPNPAAGAADVVSLGGMVLGPGAVRGAVGAIPSTARAATALDRVMTAAKDVPIDLSNGLGDVVLRTKDLASSGGAMPKVVSDFLKRAVDPKRGPISFSEARDFYSNATRLASGEVQNLSPVMLRQVREFSSSLHDALVDAADRVGMGDTYEDAIGQYRDAMKWQGRAQDVKSAVTRRALPAAATGLGLAGAYGLYRDIFGR